MYLVDGHNALHRLGLRSGDHERDRRELLSMVRELAPGAEVYFDASRAPKGLPEVRREAGMRVRYVKTGEADRAILSRVREADRPRDLTVVTDDREVAAGARQMRAHSMGVREFFSAPGPAPESPDDKPDDDCGGFSPEDFGLPKHVNLNHPPGDLE